MSQVTRITGGGNELAEYRDRAADISPGDSAGWVALGDWARDRGLHTQARESFERALAADRNNADALLALGHVNLNGRWLTSDESYRARGYEQFEGRWVLPDERRAIAAERALEAARRADAAESEARLREAEARARIAEADARRAEAEAADGGIPYPPPVYGGGYPPWAVYGPDVVVGGHGPPPPPPVVVVAPRREVLRDRAAAKSSGHHGGRERSRSRAPLGDEKSRGNR
jgi:tetratricopeptide (TPR) repeat protein